MSLRRALAVCAVVAAVLAPALAGAAEGQAPTVPLPSSGWLLLTGMFVLAGLARAVRPLELMGTAAA